MYRDQESLCVTSAHMRMRAGACKCTDTLAKTEQSVYSLMSAQDTSVDTGVRQ